MNSPEAGKTIHQLRIRNLFFPPSCARKMFTFSLFCFLLVPPWATIIIVIIVLLTLCTCLACCIRRTCRKLWKKKGVKGGKGIDLQAVKSFGLHKEKVGQIPISQTNTSSWI